MSFRLLQALGVAWLGTVLGASPGLAALPDFAGEIPIQEVLGIESLGRAGRNTLFTDLLEARFAAGETVAPKDGDTLTLPDGRVRTWTRLTSSTNGLFTGPALRGGWVHFTVESDQPRIVLLNARGHGMAYVNGEPRAGDIYRYGYVKSPVLLNPGTNTFFLSSGRGQMGIRLLPAPSSALFNVGDPTLPDLRIGEPVDTWGAVVVMNAANDWSRDLILTAHGAGRTTRTPVPPIPPLGVRKVGFRIQGPAPRGEGPVGIELSLSPSRHRRQTLDQARVELRVRRPDQTYKRTFISALDGSVQYYAINPGRHLPANTRPALFLSLHGASVEGVGQAEAYSPKRWGHLVSPTNRRPYGFDWEDWGRWDALEVLDLATRALSPDPSRIYLTGHSMGGHGTWNLGVTFPDRFAAIAPSAGWISFFSYAGTDPFTNATPVEQMLRRAAASSDTLSMATNYLHQGIYIVHGDADDNVPVREARRMREELGRFHRDFAWHEQPGAGHWWENSDEPGAECVDWPPLFEFFARHRIPSDSEVRQIQFVTVNPGISARSHWLGIDQQERALVPSTVSAQWDPGLQRVTATTDNVRRLILDTAPMQLPAGTPLTVRLDGQELAAKPTSPSRLESNPSTPGAPTWRQPVRFEKIGDRWQIADPLPGGHKHPGRSGPFKEAFRHRMVFVYGTHGTPEENAWALSKARFDAESFWYRGNGSVDVIPDTEFTLESTRDRGVIVYGHRDLNSAWPLLLGNSPVQVGRGEVRVGERRLAREDLACLFLQPRPDSDVASVGVVAGSGIRGLRLTQRLPYFMAGTGYPDCLVVSPRFLEEGTKGIVTAGFFGPDWSVRAGDWAWGSAD